MTVKLMIEILRSAVKLERILIGEASIQAWTICLISLQDTIPYLIQLLRLDYDFEAAPGVLSTTCEELAPFYQARLARYYCLQFVLNFAKMATTTVV